MWLLTTLVAVLLLQPPPEEVRIRSGVYTPQPVTIAVQSNLVELGATVRDSHGQLAAGLQASDFEVLDNGVPQVIKVFAEQRVQSTTLGALPNTPSAIAPPANAPQPRRIALFFDDTHPEPYGQQKSKEAAEKLITTGLQPEDRMGIFTGSGTVTQDFTNDTKVLLEALARVQQHPHLGAHGLGDCPRLDPFEAYVIANHLDVVTMQEKVHEVCACLGGVKEACASAPAHVQDIADVMWNEFKHDSTVVLDLLQVVIKHLAVEPGSRVLVLVSPGFATLGMENRTSAIAETALRARIVINSLNSMGLVAGTGKALRQALLSWFMSDVSAATGGQFVANSNDFMGNIRKLSVPPDVSYLMAFSTKDPDGAYHKLKVRLKNRPGLRIESRPGYFSVVLAPPPETIQQRIDREAVSAETRNEMPAAIHVSSDTAQSGLVTINVNIQVDANHLKFVTQDNRHVQQLTFVVREAVENRMTISNTPVGAP